MAEVRLKISDIDCAACVGRVHRALAACPGVESARVNYASGMAEICYDEDRTDLAGIVKCVKSAGFKVPTETALIKCVCPRRLGAQTSAHAAKDRTCSAKQRNNGKKH